MRISAPPTHPSAKSSEFEPVRATLDSNGPTSRAQLLAPVVAGELPLDRSRGPESRGGYVSACYFTWFKERCGLFTFHARIGARRILLFFARTCAHHDGVAMDGRQHFCCRMCCTFRHNFRLRPPPRHDHPRHHRHHQNHRLDRCSDAFRHRRDRSPRTDPGPAHTWLSVEPLRTARVGWRPPLQQQTADHWCGVPAHAAWAWSVRCILR